ncbi:unnamed protein product, partial [Polarella glacialis]
KKGHGGSLLDPRDRSLHFADGAVDSDGAYSDSGSDADGPPACWAAAWKCYVATLIVYLLLVGLGHLLAPHTRMRWVVLVSLGIILVSGPLFSYCLNSTVSSIVHKAVERFDQRHLGVDIDVGHITSHLGRGYVSLHDFVIHNPDGGKYKSPYLLNARCAVIDVDMWMYIRSFGKHIEIENIVFKDVDVIFEKTWSSSNIHEVLDFMEERTHKKKEEGKTQTQGGKASASISGKDPEQGGKPGDKKGGKKEGKGAKCTADQTELVLRRVVVEEVGLRVEAQMLGGFGMRLEISDIHYHDFATEVGESMADDVARVLLTSILKSAIVNAAGKSLSDKLF